VFSKLPYSQTHILFFISYTICFVFLNNVIRLKVVRTNKQKTIWPHPLNPLYFTNALLTHQPPKKELLPKWVRQAARTKKNTSVRHPHYMNRPVWITSKSLWRWYISANIMFLDIIQRRVLLKTRRFVDWILSPSSGKSYSVGPNRIELSPVSGLTNTR
jgi:hypothetical protein